MPDYMFSSLAAQILLSVSHPLSLVDGGLTSTSGEVPPFGELSRLRSVKYPSPPAPVT
jgi:hypothetical protein